jgi:hypothetical protein
MKSFFLQKRTYMKLILTALYLILWSAGASAQILSTGTASTFVGGIQARDPALCIFTVHKCEYQAFDTTGDLAFPGNGFAATTVVEDTLLGWEVFHNTQFLNDGNYGNGSAWVGDSSSSNWLKIDLGQDVDISDDALSSGQSSEGNQFVFTDDGIWQFNLKSKNYTASGEYMVTAVSGDETEYTIDPACVTSFQGK